MKYLENMLVAGKKEAEFLDGLHDCAIGETMIMTVQADDFAKVVKVIADHGDEGVKISEVVEFLAKDRNIPLSKARFVVRSALDRGKLRTDRKFRLHLTASQ